MSRTADIPPKQVTSSLVVPHKRARSNTFGIALFDTAIMTEHSRSAADVAPDPAWVLPAPTRDYITLYITLPRLEVWRVVEVPVNYSFALLHTLLQFLFGWSHSHPHQFAVYDGITISRTCKGEIEETGRVLKPDIELFESLHSDHSETHMYRIKGEDPIWRVGSSSESSRSQGEDNWVIEKDEQSVTLGDVWNQEEDQNLSYMTDGQSSNEQIAIKYEYDFNAPWIVHISCYTENPFVSKVEPSNLPRIVKAQGAVSLSVGFINGLKYWSLNRWYIASHGGCWLLGAISMSLSFFDFPSNLDSRTEC